MWLLLAFIGVPLIEIALFIQIGGAIGMWPTLAVVVITAFIGSTLVRNQGSREFGKLKQSFSELNDPSEPLANGAMILFAGALLLTPGFFTDFVGFALLIPSVRGYVFAKIKERVTVVEFGTNAQGAARPRPNPSGVIDGEFVEVDPEDAKNQGPSGWTRQP